VTFKEVKEVDHFGKQDITYIALRKGFLLTSWLFVDLFSRHVLSGNSRAQP